MSKFEEKYRFEAKRPGKSYLVSDSGMTLIYINPMTVKPKENP